MHSGERKAQFTAYADARWQRLVHAAMLTGLSIHDAEDVVQTALVRAYVKWDQVSAANNMDAYVAKLLLNTIRGRSRRRWVGEVPHDTSGELFGSLQGLSSDAENLHTESDMWARVIRELPQNQREAVVLRFFNDFSEAETAEILGIPQGTVKSRVSRALARLRQNESLTALDGHLRS